MLVEDDKSLREIYGVRLLAEGYDIVSAGDGEEALAVAIKERPHLIISDVMMPKVSGYDMLDILRSTTETKNIRVIMMTALSSEEQRQRAESLGADRYLVKSQVGIEDVVRVVHEVLEDKDVSVPVAPTEQPTAPQQQQPAQPVAPAPEPTPMPQPNPEVATPPQPAQSSYTVPRPPSLQSRVIQPIGDPTKPDVDLNQLLDKELAKEAGITEDALPPITSVDQSKAILDQQLQEAMGQQAKEQELLDQQMLDQAIHPVDPDAHPAPVEAPATPAPESLTTPNAGPLPTPGLAPPPATVPPTMPPVPPTPPAPQVPPMPPAPASPVPPLPPQQ